LGIFLNDEQDQVTLDLVHWQKAAEQITRLVGEDPEAVEWSLTFVDDAAIQKFNNEYRGYDRPTDVLSFSQLEGEDDFPMPEDGPELLGDVVVSVERAVAQSAERGHPFEAELVLLITHGLLHLLGDDHDTPERKATMWARQQAVLDALGLVVNDFGDA
jgi:probable rRNA maturation factor